MSRSQKVILSVLALVVALVFAAVSFISLQRANVDSLPTLAVRPNTLLTVVIDQNATMQAEMFATLTAVRDG